MILHIYLVTTIINYWIQLICRFSDNTDVLCRQSQASMKLQSSLHKTELEQVRLMVHNQTKKAQQAIQVQYNLTTLNRQLL